MIEQLNTMINLDYRLAPEIWYKSALVYSLPIPDDWTAQYNDKFGLQIGSGNLIQKCFGDP